MIFLANGEKMTSRSLSDYNLIDKHGAPPGFTVIMTQIGYMTDTAWEKVVPALALGIRQMSVIRDHPNWWVCMTLDGCGSHVSVHSVLNIFHDHKIMIVKEEADRSLLNQSYDQRVATCDKINVRTFLDLIRRRLPGICQWTLIAACIAGFRRLPPLMHGRPHSRWSISILTFVCPLKIGSEKLNSTLTQGQQTFKGEITFGLTPCPRGGAT
jgi:hypothetical protein